MATLVSAIIIIVGLTVAPLIYVKLFDPKKDEYAFMLIEVKIVRLVIQDDSISCSTNVMLEATENGKAKKESKKK